MSKAQELANKYKKLLSNYKINTTARLACFFGQLAAESNLELERENMNYSLERLIEIFKFRLDVDKDKKLSKEELDKAKAIAKQPRKVANFVYANRLGNGDENSDDGWKYRAGGYLGITFKGNYEALSKDTNIDFVNHPELIDEEANALIAALWFWDKNKLNLLADKGDIDAISDIINIGHRTVKIGDANGYKVRLAKTNEYKILFKK